MISSVAYATEERLSLENVDNAFHLGRRSSISCSVARGRPNTKRRKPVDSRSNVPVGAVAFRRQHACIAIAEVLGMGPRHSDSAVPRPVAWPGG
jgi:hypothetical protein